MVDTVTLSLALVGGVALVSLALAILAGRAYDASGNKKLLWVTAAFTLFCVKSLITAYALYLDPNQDHTNHPSGFLLTHGSLEVLNSGFDLAIVLCLIAPFLRRSAA